MLTTLAIIFIATGVFFFTTATIGLIRFPDFYCRMQATGKGDTLGALLSLAGLALYYLNNGFSLPTILISIKVMFIAIFIFIANPTATHAITKSGLECGVKPWTKEGIQK
ncbi:MAG: sodium:proton antiporter [Nitrospinae bacterium RIFCSPLOWO2_12_39_16]|nr:MAG: sodium:proton antiporter [Nitrospinae bacterium RIFCSPLOWO2_02_39_17]OGW09307.1 MAG: sodium:proton antiporter [Nitrospinae bacterium RIFCSPLOWO2_12_39_16]HLA48150.1 monovalent cation/H(+) antiporter subunit G [Nitrospinota bacterium]